MPEEEKPWWLGYSSWFVDVLASCWVLIGYDIVPCMGVAGNAVIACWVLVMGCSVEPWLYGTGWAICAAGVSMDAPELSGLCVKVVGSCEALTATEVAATAGEVAGETAVGKVVTAEFPPLKSERET